MKNPTDLRDLLLTKIQALYDVENQLVKALPRLVKKATNDDLKNAIDMHLKETEGHVERLEQIFEQLGEDPKKLKSEAIRGLVDDADWVVKNVMEPAVRDAGIVAAASYTEHYEMAGYTMAREWAKLLGEKDVADLLDANLKEEVAANDKLSKLAAESINEQANAVDEDEEEESEEDDKEEADDDEEDEEEK
jgi:ferritin-like metal-binding protein YciE